MRRFLLIAAAAAIALVGLSANQCGGAGDNTDEMPAKEDSMPDDGAPPADTSTPDETQ